MRTRDLKVELVLLAIGWVILALLFGIYDLEISKSLYNPDDLVSQFIENIGVVLFFKYVAGIIIVGIWARGLEDEERKLRIKKNTVFILTIFIVIIVIVILLVLKLNIYRVRFRYLDSNYSEFTSWYAPVIKFSMSDHATSFPSGHTALAFMVMSLSLFFSEKKVKYSILFGGFMWGLFVGYHRIVFGAHYASDVLFGAGISLLLMSLLYVYSFKREPEGEGEPDWVDF